MTKDSFLSPYLCTDATGVLVQNKDKCRNGHFWVLIAPDKHILFKYSAKHNSAAVDEFLEGYEGYLVSDAHSVYNHLFKSGDVIECGCWAHCRRYFFKSLGSDALRAKHALALIGNLFALERTFLSMSPEKRLEMRGIHSKPIVEEFFDWCSEQSPHVLDETPISKAIGYATNQRKAFRRFLENGILPIHNNFSERELRREAVGRKNWLFLGTDEAGEVNANFVTLLASCQMHDIEPAGYLRDLFCLLPSWNHKRILELAPAYWRKTLENENTQQLLAANVFRRISLGLLEDHPAKT